jgi:hypothetical protein
LDYSSLPEPDLSEFEDDILRIVWFTIKNKIKHVF